MIWLGVEPLVAKQTDRALALAGQAKIPMVAQFMARRAADANEFGKLVASIGQLPPSRTAMLEGLRDGLEGRANVTAPANWKAAQTKLNRSDATTVRLTGQVGQQFGDTETMGKSIAAVRDKKIPVETRRQALQLLATRQRPELATELPALLKEPGLRADAIRAVASYDEESLGRLLLSAYPTFSASEKGQAVQTLASRPKYGWLLTQAIKDKTVPKRDVPSYAARQLLRVVGSGFVEVWGAIEHNGMDEKAYAKYQRMANAKALSEADAVAGRKVFGRSCGPCHKMYGEGGIIGPELTGSNRANLDYLLFNILNPSGEIQDDYKMVVVTTRDGRTYTGNVASENERQVRMRVVGQDVVMLNKSDIQSREVTPVSMMPTGLLETLTDKEVVDLIAFMRTTEPVKTVKTAKLSSGRNGK
jgi:putative heme-binding domain-containing protein